MSRVFHALEKLEKEKQKQGDGKSPLRILEEEVPRKREEHREKASEDQLHGLELPASEDLLFPTVAANSYAAEEFRKLKTVILHRSPAPPHSILITSTTPREGKTITAMNLAITMAQEVGKEVILIDGDLRKPGIGIGKMGNGKGLSNYLSGQATIEEILADSEIDHLRIIGAGPPSQKSPELIGSERMRELLRTLRQFGDDTYILIDSPPIMSTSEPALFSKIVDGVILVVMAAATPREAARRALKSIDRQKILGIVFNQKEMKSPSEYSYYSRYYRQ